jgi:hypothetical protein
MQPAPAHPVPVLPVALEAQLAALAAALASGGSLRIGTGWVGRAGSLSLTLLSSRIGNGNGLGSLSTTRRLQRWKCAARLETCRAALSGQ